MCQLFIHDWARFIRVALIIATVSFGASAVSAAQQGAAPQCQSAGTLVRISDLPEASGVAVSRRSPGQLWAHNDPARPCSLRSTLEDR